MTEFVLPKGVGCRLRLWVDELPTLAAASPNEHKMKYKLSAAAAMVRHHRVAVELFQPISGSFRYGLLGAQFTPNSSRDLVVIIPCELGGGTSAYTESLAGQLDDVIVGCTLEYASAVIAAVEKIQSHDSLLPSGCLNFSVAAHGQVGSSPIAFAMLARAVVRLLIHEDQPRTPDEAATLLIPG